MCLVDEAEVAPRRRQGRGLLGHIAHDIAVPELDARLHHEADDPRKGRLLSEGGKGGAVQVDGPGGIGGRGEVEVGDVFGRAARHRHLGPDDIDDLLPRTLRLGHGGEGGGARGNRLFGQRAGIVGAGHTGVEVDLGEPGGGIGRDHGTGLVHRGGGGQVPPGVRAEVVAAEDHAVGRHALLAGDAHHEGVEIGGPHACIAAVLIDLIARRLDQDRAPGQMAASQSCPQDHGMRRADGGDAARRSTVLGGDQVGKEGHDRESRFHLALRRYRSISIANMIDNDQRCALA